MLQKENSKNLAINVNQRGDLKMMSAWECPKCRYVWSGLVVGCKNCNQPKDNNQLLQQHRYLNSLSRRLQSRSVGTSYGVYNPLDSSLSEFHQQKKGTNAEYENK